MDVLVDQLRQFSSDLKSCLLRAAQPALTYPPDEDVHHVAGCGGALPYFTKARLTKTTEPAEFGGMAGASYHDIAHRIAWDLHIALNRSKTPPALKADLDALEAGMTMELQLVVGMLPAAIPPKPIKFKAYKPRRGTEAELIHKHLLKGKDYEAVQELTGASATNVRKVAERMRKPSKT